MNSFTLSFLIASSVAGLVLGWQLKVRSGPDAAAIPEGPAGPLPRKRREEPPQPKSSDGASAVHALPTGKLYERMALHLLEAKVEGFPAFYEEFQKRTDRSVELNQLLFIAWTRVDPEAAIEASRGTDDFEYAYWAWACHDPGAALASAQDRKEGLENAVAGIGEFHPKWLADHWDMIPQEQRGLAIQGLMKWPDTQTPEVSIRLLLESNLGHFYGGESQTLLAFARQDPIRAYEMIKEVSKSAKNRAAILDSFIASVGRYEPGLLGEIAAASKSPVDKSKFQLGQFEGLLREDPGAARAMVEKTPTSWHKDDLEIVYASHLLVVDPERGFDYAVDFLKENGERSDNVIWFLDFETTNNAKLRQLISNMINQDGPALLNELVPESGPVEKYSIFQHVSQAWAKQDVGSYAEWLGDHQENPEVYRAGASKIADILRAKGEFEAGMEWVQSVPVAEGETNERARSLYFDWRQRDPEGAAAWRLSDKFTDDPNKFPLPEKTQSK